MPLQILKSNNEEKPIERNVFNAFTTDDELPLSAHIKGAKQAHKGGKKKQQSGKTTKRVHEKNTDAKSGDEDEPVTQTEQYESDLEGEIWQEESVSSGEEADDDEDSNPKTVK